MLFERGHIRGRFWIKKKQLERYEKTITIHIVGREHDMLASNGGSGG